jgi:probable phosphoglycerate mutase
MNASRTIARLAVLRHGPTAWNEAGRIQGRSDQPLSPAGKDWVGRWQLPTNLHGWTWYRSPLIRTTSTAALLGHPDARIEDRLIETNWGEWEGARLPELRLSLGEEMTKMEDRGLDFCPPGGESPRDLLARLHPFLKELGQRREQAVAVTHKGIIRALYAGASGWPMVGRPPEKLREPRYHIFTLDSEGRLGIERLNCPLLPEEADGQ